MNHKQPEEKNITPTPIQQIIFPIPSEGKQPFPQIIIPSPLKYSISNETHLFHRLKNCEMNPLMSQIDKDKDNQTKENRLDGLYASYTKVSDNQNKFILLFSIGIILSIVIMCLSASLFVYGSGLIGAINILVGLLAVIVLSFGIYVMRKNTILIKKVVHLRDDPEKILQSRERILLYICLYCFMVFFMYFFSIANGLMIYQSNVKMNIRGIGYDKIKWEKKFGDSTFDEIIDKVSFFLELLGGMCFLFSLFLLGIIIWLLVIIKSYRTWKVIIQFVCVIFFQASFIYVHFGIEGMKLKNITGIEDAMPGWVTLGLFVIGIIAIVISVIAFFIAFIEHKILLKAFCVVNGILSITLILLNIGGTFINANFKGYYDAQCNLLFSYVDQEYLDNHLDCKGKYLFTSNSIENFQCPKHRIVVAWEIDEEKENGNYEETYGCINQQCCMLTYSYIKEKYDYLTLLSYVLMIISVLLIFSSLYLIRNSESHFDEGIRDNFLYLFMLSMSIIITLIMIPLISIIPQAPVSSDFTLISPNETNINGTVAPSNRIIPSKEEAMQNIYSVLSKEVKYLIILQNKYQIIYKTTTTLTNTQPRSKEIGVFEFLLTTTNGYFIVNDDLPDGMHLMSNLRMDSEHMRSVLVFRATENLINLYWNYVSVDLLCKYTIAMIDLVITGLVQDITATTTRRRLVNDSLRYAQENTSIKTIELDIENVAINTNITVLEKFLDFSLVNISDTIYLYANNTSESRIDSLVYPIINQKCSSFVIRKYDHGTGVLKIGPLYLLKSVEAIEYNITISPVLENKNLDPLKQFITSIVLGGLSRLSKSPQLGEVAFYTSTQKNGLIRGIVIDSINNEPIRNIETQLILGYKSIDISDSQGQTSTYLSQSTQENGLFVFNELAPGQYTILISNSRYYLEEIHLLLSPDEVIDVYDIALTSIKDIGQLTFVLSWLNGPVDLDLHASFAIRDNQYCSVSFANQKCVEMKMEGINDHGGQNGVESMTIKTIGEHFYMIYVHKYRDISNDVAKGEQKIEGLENLQMQYIDTSKIPDTPLSQSGAVIKTYGPGYRVQITSLDIPNDEKYDDTYNYWLAFCIDGSSGISSYTIVNEMLKQKPDKDSCKKLFRFE